MLRIIAFATLILGSSAAQAELIYTATPCGGGGQNPCTVTQAFQPAENLPPLTNQVFVDYFSALLSPSAVDQNSGFSWNEIGSNADYAFGAVEGGNAIWTSYINGRDGLICCIIDWPFRLTGINSGGWIVGDFGTHGTPFLTRIDGFDYEAVPQVVSGDSVGDGDLFLAIDDQNNILAQRFDPAAPDAVELYELRPLAVASREAEVPTGSTLLLMVSSLGVLGLVRRFC